MWTWLIILVIAAYLAGVLVLVLRQDRFVYRPRRDVEHTPDEIGLEYEEVIFASGDGLALSGWYIPGGVGVPVVLVCHGNGGNIGHRLDTIRILHGLGLSVMVFDYRGYGRSQGRPDEEGTYRDARAAWDYLVQKRKVAGESIFLLGRSLGGAVAARLAGRAHPAGLIVEGAFTSLGDLGQQMYPIFPVRWLLRYRYDTRQAISRVGCPLLIVHSREDELVPVDHAHRLLAAAREPKTLVEIEGPHADAHVTSEPAYTAALREFIFTQL